VRPVIKVGDVVNFHSIIGGPVTSTGHTVTALYPMPNNFGCDCAMITGHAGVVALDALWDKPKDKILTRDQIRYAHYQAVRDCYADFGEYLKCNGYADKENRL
jgi:hypothetical protein